MTINATRAHIDAETLAAWADHGLTADAAAVVELHLSQCEHCQEVLAAFVRSAPATGAVVIPFWARRPVHWSAAGLAAAAALFLIVWTGRPPNVPTPESTVASAPSIQPIPVPPSQSSQPPPPSSSSAPVDQLQAKPTVAPPSAPSELRRDKPTAVLEDRAAPKAEAGRAAGAATALPPPAGMPVAPPPPPGASPITVTAAAPVVTPPVGAVTRSLPAVAQLAARNEFASDAFTSVSIPIEIVAPNPVSLPGRMAVGGAAARGGAARAELLQSAMPTRWRIVGGTQVERSIDAGATWDLLPIEPALTTPILAGVAASQSVCWLVGSGGVVLVTTDGRTFKRASLSEPIRLVGVVAEDGLRATVTAADGRKFSTVDGGVTWK